MTKAVFKKRLGRLVPVDEDGQALMNSIKDERDVMVNIHAARSPYQHRLFFGLIKLVVANTDDIFKSERDCRKRLMIAMGEVDIYICPDDGKTYLEPRSIAYESMDQTTFDDFFDRAISTITNRWLIGTEDGDLRQAIYDILDQPSKKATQKPRRVSPSTLTREANAA